jgi:hypothetical protein
LAIPNYIIPIKKGEKGKKNNFILYDPAINIAYTNPLQQQDGTI